MEGNHPRVLSRLWQKIRTGKDHYGDYFVHLVWSALGMILLSLVIALTFHYYTFKQAMTSSILFGLFFGFFATRFIIVLRYVLKEVATEMDRERKAIMENENHRNQTQTTWSESYLYIIRLLRLFACTVTPPSEAESLLTACNLPADPMAESVALRLYKIHDGEENKTFTKIST